MGNIVRHVRAYRNYYKKWCSARAAFVMTQGHKIIGAVAFFPRQEAPGLGFVGTASVAPSFQARGLSYALHLKCFETMQKRGLNYVGGVTTTAKVLAIAKKFKLKETGVYYVG
jgi:predicted N-acetyltransferase YhbS